MAEVLVREWADGDWEEVYLVEDGALTEVFRGHSIPTFAWIDLLRRLGVKVHHQDNLSEDE